MKKKVCSLFKFGRVIAFLLLFYQIISVTINYLEYETVIDMKVVSDIEQRPAFTFCLYSGREFPKTTRMQQIFGEPFGCFLIYSNGTQRTIKCSNLSKLVQSVTSFSHRCLSIYSHLLDEKFSPSRKTIIRVMFDNTIKIFALIHQSGTPPHFARNKIEIFNSSDNRIDLSSINTNLMPFPHSTDCYNYARVRVDGFNSREDCFVKHLKRREFDKCKCNKRWFYSDFGDENSSNICPESVKCNFDSKILMRSLEKICKNNCYNEHYLDLLYNTQYENTLKFLDAKLFMPLKQTKYEINFFYLPKMNLIEYLCSIGGLVSMWFGYSFYDFVLIFVNESNKMIKLLFRSVNFENFTLIVPKFRKIISTKFDKILSKLTIIVFSILMFYQIYEVITIYLDFEIVTRFELQEIIFLPKLRIQKKPMRTNMNELIKIYPQMIEKIKNISNSKKLYGSEIHEQIIFEDYLRKLLIDNRLNDFHRIAETEKIFKSCHHVIHNKLINCSKVDIGIAQYNEDLLIINHLNYSEISDKEKIEKITLSLNPFHTLVVYTFLSHSNSITRTEFVLNQNTITKFTFSSFSLRKLSSNENQCISEKDLKNFGEDYFDFIIHDCLFKIYNQSYGCIPIHNVREIYFDRHILKNGYKFCGNTRIDSLINVLEECLKLSNPKCNLINFNTKIETTKLLSNQTIVEFIPKKSPRIAYFETLKTVFNRLIYNCGGVLGLWFGLSPISAAGFLPIILKLLKWKIIKFIHYSKAISKKFVKILFGICKRFVLCLIAKIIAFAYYLTAFLIRFAQNLFGICKRFGLCLIEKIIAFAYNLIAFLIRFAQNLFEIMTR
jgi:hypothetical protein